MKPDHDYARPPEGVRQCSGICRRELALTDEFWDRDHTKDQGFRMVCKKCRAEARELKKQMELDERLKKLDRATLRTISKMAAGGKSLPHVSEMFQVGVQLMGGVQGLMRHVVANIIAAPPGSQTRQRGLDAILRLGVITTQEGAASVPPEFMTDDDLKRELEERQVRLRLVNGPHENDESVRDAG